MLAHKPQISLNQQNDRKRKRLILYIWFRSLGIWFQTLRFSVGAQAFLLTCKTDVLCFFSCHLRGWSNLPPKQVRSVSAAAAVDSRWWNCPQLVVHPPLLWGASHVQNTERFGETLKPIINTINTAVQHMTNLVAFTFMFFSVFMCSMLVLAFSASSSYTVNYRRVFNSLPHHF